MGNKPSKSAFSCLLLLPWLRDINAFAGMAYPGLNFDQLRTDFYRHLTLDVSNYLRKLPVKESY